MNPDPEDKGDVMGGHARSEFRARPPYSPLNPDSARDGQLEAAREAAVEAAELGTCIIDFQARHVSWDAAARRIFGLKNEGVIPFDAAVGIIHPDDVPKVRVALEDLDPDATSVLDLECRIVRHDGAVRWVVVRGRVLFDGEGVSPRPSRALCLVMDVTERKQAETQFLRIVEAAPSGLVLVNAEGKIDLANPEAERAFGYEPGELLGRSVETLVPERSIEGHSDWRRDYLGMPSARPMGAGRDLYGRRKDGTEFPVEIGLTPVEGAEGPTVLATVVDITARKRAETQFLHIFEAAPSGLVLVNSDGRIELANPEAERTFGYARGELPGHLIETLVPERSRGNHGGWRQRYLTHPSARPMGAGRDLFGRRKDGSEFPVEIGLTPVDAADGPMVLATVVDITERKRHEWSQAFLLELESELQQLDDADEIAQVALRSVCGYVGASRCLFAGYDRVTDHGVVHYEHAGSEDHLAGGNQSWESVTSQVLRVQLSGKALVVQDTANDEHTARMSADFERIGVGAFVAIPFVQAGEWLAALVVHDRQPRRWREDEVRVVREVLHRVWPRILQAQTVRTLRESEVRLRLASELAGLGVFEWDVPSDNTVWQNDRMYEIFAHSREDGTLSMDQFFRSYLHPDDVPSFEQALKDGMQRGRRMQVVCRVRRKDGELRWLEFSGDFDMARDGTPLRLVCVLGDITARRSAEQALKRLTDTLEERVRERTEELKSTNRKLQQRNRELQDFAYVASHDLKEPLRKISTFAELTIADYGDAIDETGQAYLERMQGAAIRMSGLLDDLLRFSKIETQGQPFARIGLDEVMGDVLSDLEILTSETRSHIHASPMPEIEADPSQMRQLFQNLIQNAIKFRRPGHEPSVTIRSEIDDTDSVSGNVRIIVQDNGIGFEQKYAERIFSPFQRLHAQDSYDGMGMGLAICRRIVERHGGEISARSAPDEGTEVTIVLPIRQVGAEQARPESPVPLHREHQSAGNADPGGEK